MALVSMTVPEHVVVLFLAIAGRHEAVALVAETLNHVSLSHALLQRFHE